MWKLSFKTNHTTEILLEIFIKWHKHLLTKRTGCFDQVGFDESDIPSSLQFSHKPIKTGYQESQDDDTFTSLETQFIWPVSFMLFYGLTDPYCCERYCYNSGRGQLWGWQCRTATLFSFFSFSSQKSYKWIQASKYINIGVNPPYFVQLISTSAFCFTAFSMTVKTIINKYCSFVIFIHQRILKKIIIGSTTIFNYIKIYIQWGKKVFSQPPIVQVLPLKKMREACNFHHRYTSTMIDKIRKKKNPENHIVGFLNNLLANYGGK